jgi:hypothetical protein
MITPDDLIELICNSKKNHSPESWYHFLEAELKRKPMSQVNIEMVLTSRNEIHLNLNENRPLWEKLWSQCNWINTLLLAKTCPEWLTDEKMAEVFDETHQAVEVGKIEWNMLKIELALMRPDWLPTIEQREKIKGINAHPRAQEVFTQWDVSSLKQEAGVVDHSRKRGKTL